MMMLVVVSPSFSTTVWMVRHPTSEADLNNEMAIGLSVCALVLSGFHSVVGPQSNENILFLR